MMKNIDFTYKVEGRKVIITPVDGFLDNSIYTIDLDVNDINNNVLEKQIKFCTKLSPLYADINSIISLLGPVAKNIEESSVLYNIRSASLFANYMLNCERKSDNPYHNSEIEPIDEDEPPFEIVQFVRYKAAYDCLINYAVELSSATGLSGTVGNVTFSEKETNRDINKLLKTLKDEVDKWSDEVKGYQMAGHAKSQIAVMGSHYLGTDVYYGKMPGYHVPHINYERGV